MIENLARLVLKRNGNIAPLLLRPEDTKGTGTTNPSILVDGDKIWVNVRHVEYTLYHSEKKKYGHPWGPIVYLHGEHDLNLRTNNFLGVYGNSYTPTRVDTSALDQDPVWEFIGLEDARLVKWDGDLYLCGVRRDTKPNGEGRMELSKICPDTFKELSRQRIPSPGGDGSYCEKNWMPVLDMPWHFVKWCNPTELVKFDPASGTCETVLLGSKTLPLSYDLRGGSQVIPYKDGMRMALVHQVDLYKSPFTQRKDARYRHRFIVWDRDWNVVKVTEPFDLMGAEVEFVCGADWYNGNLLITFGVQDNSAMLMTIPGVEVDKLLSIRPKVVDYFMYHDEKELLELRINALYDHVDKFIISEADRTFSGVYKGHSCAQTIKDLGLRDDKIDILEVELPEHITDELITDWDRAASVNSGCSDDPKRIEAWVRERIQKDAIQVVLKDYADDDVFIMSDCDELIKPDMVSFVADMARHCESSVVRLPLAVLEGRADLRVYDKTYNVPEAWDKAAYVCQAKHLRQVEHSKIRLNDCYPIESVWLTRDGGVMQDLGWHFSWMGTADRRIKKAESFLHYADSHENFIFNTFGSDKMYEFMSDYVAEPGAINPCGQKNTELRPYDVSLLPPEVLSLPRVRSFLLPNQSIPVMGTAIVNGVHWLQRLIDSVDYPVDKFVIINNNGRGQITEQLDDIARSTHKYIKSFHVCHMPDNIGCPGAWNLIIKSSLHSPYWLIVNHDVAFTPGTLQSMVREASEPLVGMVHGSPGDRGTGMYDLFILKDWVVQQCGLFDENFSPAYGEDLDYIIRTADVRKVLSVSQTYLHGQSDYATTGSQTWRTEPELKDKLDASRVLNETEYMVDKWGKDWYNAPMRTTHSAEFDLNFVRRKSLWT